jgi:hypothetical protein
MFENLTGYEIDALPCRYNLTDGHVFRRWSAAEKAIIDRAARLFEDNTRQGQPRIEREYVGDFLSLARQTHDERRLGYLMWCCATCAFRKMPSCHWAGPAG